MEKIIQRNPIEYILSTEILNRKKVHCKKPLDDIL
jgi:hypothetical protein